MTSETTKYDAGFSINAAIWIKDPTVDTERGFDRMTILTLNEKSKTVIIRIDWCNYSTAAGDSIETMLLPESNLLLFGARFFWGIIDLKTEDIMRLEDCGEFWNFYRYSESIVITKELEAESINFKGETIDKVPIDPPWESKDLQSSIVFESPAFGKQTLKLKK